MNIVKKISEFLGIVLLSSAAWGMQDSKEQLGAPEEAEATTSSHVLRMIEWEKEDRAYAISDEGYTHLKRLLLEEENQYIIHKIGPMVLNRADFFAAFIFYSVDILIAKNTVDNTTLIAVDNFAKEIVWKPAGTCEWTAINDAAKKIIKNMSWESYREEARTTAMNSVWEGSWYSSCEAGSAMINKVLDKLGFEDHTARMHAAEKLINLHTIAIRTQNRSAERLEAFSKIKKKANMEGFSMPVDEMLALFAAALWNNPQLAQNPHVMILRNAFERFAQKISLEKERAASFPPRRPSYFADTESPSP